MEAAAGLAVAAVVVVVMLAVAAVAQQQQEGDGNIGSWRRRKFGYCDQNEDALSRPVPSMPSASV